MKPGDLKKNAEAYEADHPDEYGLTFWSYPDRTADEIAREVGTVRLPHPVLRKSTARQVRSLVGSDECPMRFEKTYGAGHYTLYLPSPPTDDDYEKVSEPFDPPQPNPVARPRGQ